MIGDTTTLCAYHLARGNVGPSNATKDAASAALVRASDYIRAHYVARLAPGYDESLQEVIDATYIAAGIEVETPGFFSKTYTEAERKVLTKVEGISWTVTGQNGPDAMAPRSTLIEAKLRPFLNWVAGPVVV